MIAGFSLSLSYSSTLYQQLAAGIAGASTSGTASAGTSASGTSSGGSTTTASASTTPSSSTATTSAATSASSTIGSSSATTASTPQQTIAQYVQNVMSKLGRTTGGGGSNKILSPRWKLGLLAQALPAYARAQSGTSSGSTSSTTQAAKLAAATLNRLAA